MTSPLNLRQIEVFSAIMRTGSITEAAKTLSVSQPSVSKVLKHAELRLGFQLFKRTGGRLYPTPEAEILYAEIARIDENVAQLSQLAFELRDIGVGRVRIGSPPSLAAHVLPMGVEAFRARQANIAVQLTVSPSSLIRTEVVRCRVDLSLAHFPVTDPEVEGITLDRGRMVCLMRNNHALANRSSVGIDDLIGQNMILWYADQVFLRLIDRAMPELRENVNCDLLVNHFSVAVSLAQRGLGIALIDDFSISGCQFDDMSIVPLEPEIPVDAGVIHPRYKPLSTSAQQFIEILRNVLRQFRKSL